MAGRTEYNECMKPFMSGSKTKEERQRDMCIGAKICSGKANTQEEAESICRAPKLPKWAQTLIPSEDQNESCSIRMQRNIQNIDAINLKIREGEAEEVKEAAAQLMADIFHCHKDDEALLSFVSDIMGEFHTLTKQFYFKGEAKEVESKLNILKEALSV